MGGGAVRRGRAPLQPPSGWARATQTPVPYLVLLYRDAVCNGSKLLVAEVAEDFHLLEGGLVPASSKEATARYGKAFGQCLDAKLLSNNSPAL